MPKRKSDDDSLLYIKKKMKKLERKLLRRKRRRSTSSSSSDQQISEKPEGDPIEVNYVDNIETVELPGPSASTNCLNSLLSLEEQEVQQEIPLLDANEEILDEKENQNPELDKEFLDILGADPTNDPIFGKEIQKDLSVRLEFIATNGLTKERRKELIESYLPPANCKLIDAPALNPEIKAAITEVVQKRDKALFTKQKQICSAISGVSQAITCIFESGSKDPTILKHLMDTERILCDLQHNESLLRRNFILAGLKKELKDQIQLTKVDHLLFGEGLTDTLRAAKAISKTGDELKNINQTNLKQKSVSVNKNLNWRAPAPYRRPTGPPRAKESAPLRFRQPQGPFYRASRPNNTRNNR